MSRTRPLVALATVVALIALSSCAGSDGPPADSAGATSNPVSTPGTGLDNPLAYRAFSRPASPQCVALGRRFALVLEATPSAGLRWEIQRPAPDPDVLTPVGTEFVPPPAAAPDDPEVQRINYAAKGLGTTDVTLVTVGPDGTPVPDREPETWTITVTEDGTCPPETPDTTLPRQS